LNSFRPVLLSIKMDGIKSLEYIYNKKYCSEIQTIWHLWKRVLQSVAC